MYVSPSSTPPCLAPPSRVCLTAVQDPLGGSIGALDLDFSSQIRVSTLDIRYPFPPTISKRYLHTAKVMPGHEPGGPSVALPLNTTTIIGLSSYHMDGKQERIGLDRIAFGVG
jgi:hypothetical protein